MLVHAQRSSFFKQIQEDVIKFQKPIRDLQVELSTVNLEMGMNTLSPLASKVNLKVTFVPPDTMVVIFVTWYDHSIVE